MAGVVYPHRHASLPSEIRSPGTTIQATDPSNRSFRPSAGVLALALLLLFAGLAAHSARQHSEVLHERHYIYAGWQKLRNDVTGIAAGTPSGLPMLSAVPLLALDLDSYDGPAPSHPFLNTSFVYENQRPAHEILAFARAPFVLLGVLAGAVVFVWARRLYGDAAGLLALGLYVFNPAMLGNTQFATQDFPVAALATLTLFAFWRLCESGSPWWVVGAGVALGLALLTKYTALALLPLLGVVTVWDAFARPVAERGLGARIAGLAGVGAIAALIVWAAYGFDVGSLGETTQLLASAHGPLASFSVCPQGLRHPGWVVPAPEYLCGVSSQLSHAYRIGHPSYLAGEVSAEGWWRYYLVTMAVKQPIALLLLLAARAGWGFVRLARGERGGELRFLLAFPLLLLWVFSAADTQLGERYILAVYPPLFVWLGALARPAWQQTITRVALLAALAWIVVSTARIHPHHLMYFNEIAGGPDRGWRTVVSGYDMGQDLGNLERWLAEREISQLRISCLGCDARLEFASYRAERLPCRETPGWVAISVARRLIPAVGTPVGCHDWLGAHEPVARVGHSILVYEVPSR